MKFIWIATVISGLIFTALLGSRVAMLRPPEGPLVATSDIPGKDVWMNISQKGRKIGYSHRLLFPEDDRYVLEETMYMRINTMGVLQTIQVHTEAVLNVDLSLLTFAFTTRSGRFEYNTEGRVENGQLVVTINGQDSAIPIERTIYLASGILDFGNGTSTFTCSTQLSAYQRVNILGTEGRVEIEIPFNAPPDRPSKMWHQSGDEIEKILFDVVDQYTIQGDLFSLAVLNDTPVPTPLEDAVANMKVIETVVRSGETGTWV